MISENQRVRDATSCLRSGDVAGAGEILTDGHHSLRDDFDTSTAEMDAAVAALCATPGVLGARMTGGGFGGAIVALAETERADDLLQEVLEAYRRAGHHGRGLRTLAAAGAGAR